jgi:hypothetical protein
LVSHNDVKLNSLLLQQAEHMADSTKTQQVREFFIQGLTSDGKQFRPSDWAERLCGAMSCFSPDGGRHSHLQYSPYVRPILLNGVRSVVVNEAIRDIEPLAYHFVVSFAKDNDLQIIDACLLPDEPKAAGK